MSRQSKLIMSNEDIWKCLLELDTTDSENDIVESDIMYDSYNDREYFAE